MGPSKVIVAEVDPITPPAAGQPVVKEQYYAVKIERWAFFQKCQQKTKSSKVFRESIL